MARQVQFENGTKIEFDKEPTQQDIEEAFQQVSQTPEYKRNDLKFKGEPVSVNPDKAKPSLLGGAARAIIKPIAREATNLANIPRVARGEQPTYQPFSGDYLGEVKPVGQEGNFGQQLKDSVGTALDVASTVVTPGGVSNVAKQGVKGLVGSAIRQGAKEGAIIGGIQGSGTALARPDSTVASTLLGGTGGALAGGLLGGATGGVIGKGTKTVAKNTKLLPALKDELKIKNALDVIQPVLNKSEKQIAAGQGRVGQKGALGTYKIDPSPRDIAVATSVKDVVKRGAGEQKNIGFIQGALDKTSKEIRDGLGESKAIWNKNELAGKLNQIDINSPDFINVKSDKVLQNKFNNFKSAIFKLADTADKKPVGLLDLRQNFDDVVKRAFPNLYSKESEMLPVVRAFRESLNDFAASKLPDGKLPSGQSIRDAWLNQSNMIRAKENLAEKLGQKAGTTLIDRLFKGNTAKVVGGAVGLGALYSGAKGVAKAAGTATEDPGF